MLGYVFVWLLVAAATAIGLAIAYLALQSTWKGFVKAAMVDPTPPLVAAE